MDALAATDRYVRTAGAAQVNTARRPGCWGALLGSAAVVMCALTVVEGVCRELDGYVLAATRLRPSTVRLDAGTAGAADVPYMRETAIAHGVSRDWYDERPPAAPRIPLTPELQQRARRYPNDLFAPFFEWNLAFLQDQVCRNSRDVTMGSVRDFYYFESLDGSPFPTFRHLRHISPPFWFVTNAFGWRGPEVVLNKPPDTVRIAFVGASTTIDNYSVPFSHPEMVGYWLNRWAEANGRPYRFDVINAGRTGINSHSIAAIVTQELLPVAPDLVVFYEGANQFWPHKAVTVHATGAQPASREIGGARTLAAAYSALGRRIFHLLDRAQAGDGREPRKPPSTIDWPSDVDEADPAVDSPHLPMDLPAVVRDLDTMRQALAAVKAELVIASFVWMVHDGMTLDVDRDLTLYEYLNRSYWPITYAEMHRLAVFQNRVFENYARVHRLPFIDIASEYPVDPSLAGDAIHLRYPGLALQAWMFLQHLIPIVEQRVADGRLPARSPAAHDVHPAFNQPSLRAIGLDELRARCPQP